MMKFSKVLNRFMQYFKISGDEIAYQAVAAPDTVRDWIQGTEEPTPEAADRLLESLWKNADSIIDKDETQPDAALSLRVQEYYDFLKFLSTMNYYPDHPKGDNENSERFACEGVVEAAPQADKLRIVVLHEDIPRMKELQATVKYYPDLSIVAYERSVSHAIIDIDTLKPQVLIMSALVGYELPLEAISHVEKMPVRERPHVVVLAESGSRAMKRVYSNLPLSKEWISIHDFERGSYEDDVERLFSGFYRIEGNTVKLPLLGQYRELRVTEIDGQDMKEISIMGFVKRYLGYRIRKFRTEAKRTIPEICKDYDEVDEETFYLAENGCLPWDEYDYPYLHAALGHEDTDELMGAGHLGEMARKIIVNPQPYLQEYMENAPRYFTHFKNISIDVKYKEKIPVKAKARRLHSRKIHEMGCPQLRSIVE